MAIHIAGLDERLSKLDKAAYQHRAVLQKFFRWHITIPSSVGEQHSVFRLESNDNQRAYVLSNFVFQGGGVLGIAHLGFLYAMERIGVRAVGVAGTSAGAIVSILIAAARGSQLHRSVADRLLPVLWSMPAGSFIDGPYSVRRLVKYALRHKTIASLEMSGPIIRSASRLLRTYGLNTGNAFEEWLSEVLLKQFDIRTIAELSAHLEEIARSIDLPLSAGDLLKIVATALPQAGSMAVPVGVKLTFPQDLSVLSAKYQNSSPALLARASMSVPIFFDPLTLELHASEWKKYAVAHLQGILSSDVLQDLCAARLVAFIDGGMLSNFPIDAFLRDIGPRANPDLLKIPTVGVTLTSGGRAKEIKTGALSSAIEFAGAAMDGMRHARDRDAIAIARLSRATDLISNVTIAPVDTGSHNWLNFQLNEVDLSDLFLRGIDGVIRMMEELEREAE